MAQVIVVLPTYNEAENLALMVETLLALPVEDLSVLVVDDNSPDGTGDIADRLTVDYPDRVQVLHRPGKQGLSQAYKAGLRRALDEGADLIVQMDCDFSHPPDKLPEMIARAADHDLVIGSRYIKGGSTSEEWGVWRKLLSLWANRIYVGLILRTRTKDTTAGYRVWNRVPLLSIDFDLIRSTGYIFLVEMAFVAERLGFSIFEVPIHFAERRDGTSKMTLRIQIEAALRVWQVFVRHRGLRPSDRLPVDSAPPSQTSVS